MDNPAVTLTIDQPQPGVLSLTLRGEGGQVIDNQEMAYQGHVDNLLLTTVDNLLGRNTIHRSALKAVEVGQGIDKNSSLYRIVISLAAAVMA